ncbi:MAG: hypothetical protein H6736_03655 [Alphaproteobacteria bacterium]|nr:hypothetical protein [Alphaproteobacteria bacterium]
MRALLLALLGCKGPATPSDTPPPEPTPLPATCDAGDEAWVQRAIPLMWGRRALGAGEVYAWSGLVAQHGREAVLHAMTKSPEYVDWWGLWLTDTLAVARTGDKAFSQCFQNRLVATYDGSLTQHVRGAAEPWNSPWDQGSFTMADLLRDAIVADDLAVPFQAHLYARMARPVTGANVSLEELEYNRRVNFGEGFYETWLNRNLDCVVCHNSSFSTTDAPDARFDRTWQLPGRHETALLGDNTDFDKASLYAMFRHAPVSRENGGRRPWGMSASCGYLRGPDAIAGPDMLAQDTSFFVQPYGATGTVWDVERTLAAGADSLATTGLLVGEDGTVDGAQSFAYLVGARIVDRVFEASTGGRLTISHGFPRNLAQASRLEGYTDTFVTSGFSLETLLVAITADPLFNPGLPSECDARPYGLDPVVNPWSVEDEDTAKRPNSPGDLAHRLPARVLYRSAHAHLGRGAPAEWNLGENEEDFQATLGVFLRESQPGFNGTDFQGLLAWQARFATCGNVGGNDWISGYLEQAASFGTTGDLVQGLKDHLLADSTLTTEEIPLLESLVGPLDAPGTSLDERSLRLVCGAILTSSPYMLAVTPTTSPPPILAPTADAWCAEILPLAEAAGLSATSCVPGR